MNSPAIAIAVLTVVAALLMMGGELVLSRFNEQQLRAKGAVEPTGDVIDTMRWVYPVSFLAMGVEGAMVGPSPDSIMVAGLVLFGFAKALKVWAISSLGPRWSYRVLIVPGAPLVTSGPYRFMAHPNYLAVVGELVSVAMIVAAPITGVLATIAFGRLMRARIRVEDRALGRLRQGFGGPSRLQ
jgi:methyltransferase